MSNQSPAEYLIEFYPMGHQVKVSAVCTQTMVEVSIVGPASAGQATLKRNVIQKLDYMKAKKASS